MTDRFDHLFLACADFDASLAFYRDTLGWTVQHESGDDHRLAVLASEGGMSVVLSEQEVGPEGADAGSGINGHRPTTHIKVEDIEARYRSFEGKPEVVVPLQETHWGPTWFVVQDPDGNLLAFTS